MHCGHLAAVVTAQIRLFQEFVSDLLILQLFMRRFESKVLRTVESKSVQLKCMGYTKRCTVQC